MKIYLIRHGESANSLPDDERQLTDQGIADIKGIANFIAPFKLHVSYIYQSPKRRTQQTAKLLSNSFFVSRGVAIKNNLVPMADVNEILNEIIPLNEDILLVSHMPFLGRLISKLTTGNEYSHILSFNPGTLVRLQKNEQTNFVIDWILSPELFR